MLSFSTQFSHCFMGQRDNKNVRLQAYHQIFAMTEDAKARLVEHLAQERCSVVVYIDTAAKTLVQEQLNALISSSYGSSSPRQVKQGRFFPVPPLRELIWSNPLSSQSFPPFLPLGKPLIRVNNPFARSLPVLLRCQMQHRVFSPFI